MGNHRGQAKPLTGPLQDDAVSPVAGRVEPALNVVHADARPPAHRPLLHHLERSITDGRLRDSPLAPVVLEALRKETELELANPYDRCWITTGIGLGDEYFTRVRLSAGVRDWQRDFARTATPIIVAVARSLGRSADAQALVVRLCDVLAARLRLKLIWPKDPDALNDVKNAIYRKCLDATEIESDEVLQELGGLSVIGPQ